MIACPRPGDRLLHLWSRKAQGLRFQPMLMRREPLGGGLFVEEFVELNPRARRDSVAATAPLYAEGALAGIGWLDTGFVVCKNMLAGIIRPIGHVATAASVGRVVISIRVPGGRDGGADVATTKLPPRSGPDGRRGAAAPRASPRGLVSPSAASSRRRVPGRPPVAVGDHRVPAPHGRRYPRRPDGRPRRQPLVHREYRPTGLARIAIGRITPSGAITEFPLPAGDGSSGDLTVGPDGNLWFTASPCVERHGTIGRITPAGAITEFPLPARP